MPIDNNCTHDKLYSGMPGGSRDYNDEGTQSDQHDAIPTASRRQRAVTDVERSELRPSDDDGYEGEDGDNEYADKDKEASQVDDQSTQNVEG